MWLAGFSYTVAAPINNNHSGAYLTITTPTHTHVTNKLVLQHMHTLQCMLLSFEHENVALELVNIYKR